MKILVNAYACNPYKGSEEGVGWGWVRMIAQKHEVHVLVAAYHRDDIERYLAAHPDEAGRMHFYYPTPRPWHYRPTPGWKKIEHSMLKPIMNYAYRLWLVDAYRMAKHLHEEHRFDLAHQLTYVGFRFPGYLWKLDIPFVWGPLGGLENTPWRFLPAMGLKGAVYYSGRNVINTLHKLTLITPRLAFAKAGPGVIAATDSIAKEIDRWYGVPATVISEIGPPELKADGTTGRKEGEPFRLSWSGEHLPGKALPLLLEALAVFPAETDWRLDILGTGPLTEQWKRTAGKLGIAERCVWHGKLPRDEAVGTVHDSHVFVITSMKDLTSTVLLEALSQGVPVVCPDHCGFSNVVTPECGIKIGVDDIRSFVDRLGKALLSLESDEPARRAMARGALDRIAVYTWEAKAKQLEAVYRDVMRKETA